MSRSLEKKSNMQKELKTLIINLKLILTQLVIINSIDCVNEIKMTIIAKYAKEFTRIIRLTKSNSKILNT